MNRETEGIILSIALLFSTPFYLAISHGLSFWPLLAVEISMIVIWATGIMIGWLFDHDE